MEKLSLHDPLFATYVVAATLMILTIALGMSSRVIAHICGRAPEVEIVGRKACRRFAPRALATRL